VDRRRNALFGTGTIVANTGSLTPPAAGEITFTAGVPYSMTAEIRVTGTAVSNVSLSLDNNNMITPTPAPGGVSLALAGLPALAFGVWLRRRRIPVSV